MKDKIIICSNYPGSGKSSVANYLKDKYNFIELSFAYYIYKIAYDLFNMIGKERQLLLDIGENLRQIDPNVFVNYTLKTTNIFTGLNKLICISDMRKLIELEKAIQEGFVPIRVVCNKDIIIKRLIERDGKCNLTLLENDTEDEVKKYPMYEINNNGSIDDLHKNIDNLVRELIING